MSPAPTYPVESTVDTDPSLVPHPEVQNPVLTEKGTIDDRTNAYTVTQRGQREIEAHREWEDGYLGDLLEEAAAD